MIVMPQQAWKFEVATPRRLKWSFASRSRCSWRCEARSIVLSPTANNPIPSFDGCGVRLVLTHVIREQLCAEWFLEALCLGFGFESLDLIGDASIGWPALPFGLGRHCFVAVWQAAKLQA